MNARPQHTLWILCLALVLCSALSPRSAAAQAHYNVRVDTVMVPGLPGLHSFAIARHEGKWLLLGGRQDGMHPKFGGFGANQANVHIRVVDPQTAEVWERPLSGLPDTLREQLQSANMVYHQHEETLLFVGGYGRSELAQNHITYPYLTLIDVPALIEAVVSGGPMEEHFQQIRDPFFAVTGGQMQRLADTFYLAGGHRFDGVYSANSENPFQAYTNGIRKFMLQESEGRWQVSAQQEVLDELNLHRRDYNLSPSVFADGEVGFTLFAGVFQPGFALAPFLNLVEVRTSAGHASVEGFSQFLANYHCARVPLYAQSANEMHTCFFGGISRYWIDEQGALASDGRLPFVNTISRVTRRADGSYEEVAFDNRMPYYTGTGAEFVLAEGVPVFAYEMIDYDALPDGSNLLGYIVGGIVSPDNQRNPFVANTVGITSANAALIRVYLEKNPVTTASGQSLDGRYDLGLSVSPNPTADQWQLSLNMPAAGRLRYLVQDAGGRLLRVEDAGLQQAGPLTLWAPAADLPAGLYHITVNIDGVWAAAATAIRQ